MRTRRRDSLGSSMAESAERLTIASILNPGRMLADGVPFPDYREATEQIGDLSGWFDFWIAKGSAYEALGDAAIAAGNPVSGGEWLWYASLSFHYAQFMWFHDPTRREQGQRRKVDLYNRAAPLFIPAAKRIEVACEGAMIPGFLRLPEGERPTAGWPTVLLIGGLESTKEEGYLFENICLRRGLATFAFDGPGQGEMFFDVKLVSDFERYTSAVLDHLVARTELDAGRIGVLGRSLGGHYALRSAASDSRLKACCAWGAFFDMSEFRAMPLTTQRGFAYVAGAADLEAGEQLNREKLNLADVIGQVRCPVYVLHGAHDLIFSLRQLELVRAGLSGPGAEVVVEPDGDHCCHNMGPIVRPRMADWMAARLAA